MGHLIRLKTRHHRRNVGIPKAMRLCMRIDLPHGVRKWHLRANRNEGEDRSILRHGPGVEAILNDWRADPEIGVAEKVCIDWFTARKAHVLTPATIAAWTHADYTGGAA